MRAQGEGLRRSPTRLAARQTDRLTDWRTDWLSLSDSSGQLYEYEAYLNIKPNRTEPHRTEPSQTQTEFDSSWVASDSTEPHCLCAVIHDHGEPLWATVLVAPFLIVAFMICQKKNFLKTQPKVKDQVQELRSKYHFTHLFFAKSFACAGAARSAKIQRSPLLLPPPLSWAIKQQFAQWVFGFF